MSHSAQHFTFFLVFSGFLFLVGSSPVPNVGGKIYLLDIGRNPQEVIDIPSNSSAETFQIFTPDFSGNSHWNISLVLQSMECLPGDSIVIMNPSQTIWTTWCTNTSNTPVPSNFAISGVSHFYITIKGLWSLSTATLIATIYYDTSENCDCGRNFCCTSKCPENPSSLGGVLMTSKPNYASPRCISSNLICNDLPNCGFLCPEFQEDESNDVCSLTTSTTRKSNNVGPRIWVFVVATLGGLIGFGFIITFFVIFLSQRNKRWSMQKETLNHQLSISVRVPVRNSIADSLSDPPTPEEVSIAVFQTLQRLSMETDQISLGNKII